MTFQPTHSAPPGGLPTWDVPDPARPPGPHLEAGLPVEVVQVQGGWTLVRCSNSWEAWVDGSRLVPAGAAMSPGVTGAGTTGAPTTLTVPTTTAAWTALAVGAAVVLLSFLPWFSISGGGASFSRTAWKVPAAFLVDSDADPDGIKLALLLLLIGAVTAGLALFAPTSKFAWWAGGPILAVTLLYIVQLTRVTGLGLGDVGFGAWLTGVAGIACLVIPFVERASNTGTSKAASAISPVATIAPTTSAAQPAQAPATPVASPAATPVSATPGWVPTHRVPASGARCYERPDPDSLVAAQLDPGLPVAVTEETMGWAHITCSNGWTIWVDGRPLEPLA